MDEQSFSESDAALGLATTEGLRESRKQKFLDAMGRMNIIAASCFHAGITRNTVLRWRNEGFLSIQEIDDAYSTYKDMLRGELHKRAFVGVEKQIYSNGHPVLDRNGEPVIQRVIDSKLLLALCQKHLPEMKEADQLHVLVQQQGGGNDIPESDKIVFDSKDFQMGSPEWETLKQIARNIEMRKKPTIEGSVSTESTLTSENV